jgi:Ca2+-binding RTX toxin-like protein
VINFGTTTGGAQSLNGGAGNDTITVLGATVDAADDLIGGDGTNDIFVFAGATSVVATGNLDATFTGFERINLQQTTANATIVFNDTANVDVGIVIDATSMTTGVLSFTALAAETGTHSVTGGQGSDSITGGAGADTLIGGAGGDTLSGGDGADRLEAGDGNNLVIGGVGIDTIVLGTGSNVVAVATGAGPAADVVTGFNTGATGAGGDVVRLSDGNIDTGVALTAQGGAAGSVTAGAAVVLQTLAPGATVAGAAGANLFIVSGTTGTNLASALNGASVTGLTTASDHLVVYYDADLNGGSMVVAAVDTGANTSLEAGDAELIMVTLAMTAAEFNATIAGNFAFG